MKKIFLIFVIIITGTLLLSEEQKMEPLKEEIKKLLPPNSAICKCASFSNKPKVKIGKYKYPGPWYGNSIQELNEWGKNIKEQDCIIQSDVDDDGKNELIVAYYENDNKNDDLSRCYLCIYKKINDKYVLQFQAKGGWVTDSLEVDNLLDNKKKQIVWNSGTGASIGYGLFVFQYDGHEYKSMMPARTDLNWGYAIIDIDNDKEKEIICHNRYGSLPLVYKWNNRKNEFEIMSDKNQLIKYYKMVINIVKDPFNEEKEFDYGYALALFECYDKLNDYKNAMKMGKQLMLTGGGFNWYDSVKARMSQLEKNH